ncbi:MAG: hypothetical protein R2744_05480 [Bacteroidales bacterium]
MPSRQRSHRKGIQGHIFWDELFILPFFNLHLPEVTKANLLYRYRRLEEGQEICSCKRIQGSNVSLAGREQRRGRRQVMP